MQQDKPEMLSGIVEADETFVGGKINGLFPRKKNQPKKPRGQEHLKPILGMVQRKGKVIAQVIDKPSKEIIMPILRANVHASSTLVTDASYVYLPVKKHFEKHMVMSGGSKIFKRGIYHKNTIEGFWSLFQRALMGQYHKVAIKHLQIYVDEVCFKYNHRFSTDKGYNFLLQKLIKVDFAKS